MERIKIGFVGTGNMAGAIIRGIVKNGSLPPEQIGVYDVNEQAMTPFVASGHRGFESVEALVKECGIVTLSVKPQNFTDVLPQVKAGMQPDTVLVSIAAGITAQAIQDAVGFACKVVLVMPNTPLLLGQGATALSRVEPTTVDEFEYVKGLFALAGLAEEIRPEQMNEIIPVNGSSPAYVYRFARVIAEYAQAHGIDGGVALRLVAQTLIGSAHMLLESGKSPQELIDMVCSPGGTTLASMHSMDETGFDASLTAACEACLRRAGELAEGK